MAKLNKLSFNENVSIIASTAIKEKLQVKNAASVYHFSNLFRLQSLHKTTLRYIECCFTAVGDTESLLELEYKFISKILKSSELSITSEIEVLQFVDRWLNHNIEERSKYAKDLLLKVRVSLLSKDTIRHLSKDVTFLKSLDIYTKFLNEVLDCNENYLFNASSTNHCSRYCNHKMFKVLVCGGFNSETSVTCSNVTCIDFNRLGVAGGNISMTMERVLPKIVYIKGDLYVFGGWKNKKDYVDIMTNYNLIMSVEKYSLASKTWMQVAEMFDKRYDFLNSACAFMDKIYIFGGLKDRVCCKSCLQFDTKDHSWKEVAEMNDARSGAACVVFEERIVVSGGWSDADRGLSTVESYDVLPNRWSSMPNMNFRNDRPKSVVVKNKLFILASRDNCCEVFDNICKKFVYIKSPCIPLCSQATSIGSKIVFIHNRRKNISFYDVEKRKWSEKTYEVIKDLQNFSCVKVPFFN